MTAVPNQLDQPLTEDEIGEFEDLLFEPFMPEDVFDLETLDGFLCGLICAPRLIMPSEFLPEVFGGGAPTWPDAATAARFHGLLMRRWNEIAVALGAPVEDLNDPRAYAPYLLEASAELVADYEARRTANDPPLPLPGQAWAEGVLLALEFAQADWNACEPALGAQVDQAIDALTALADIRPESGIDEDALGERIAQALWAAYDLRDLGRLAQFERERPREPVRAEASPGRNDPCPCGSGKKYKKCCGAPDTLH